MGMTAANAALTLGANFQNLFVPVFSLNSISAASYVPAKDNGRLAEASCFTIAVNVISALIVMWWMPSNKDETRQWATDSKWHRTSVGIIGVTIFSVAFVFSVLVSFLSIFPETNCLKLAGGDGC